MTDDQRAELTIAWRRTFVSVLNCAASYLPPAPLSLDQHLIDVIATAATIAEIDVRAEAEEQRRLLRAKFGLLAYLTPDWWTVRRFERLVCGVA